MIGAVRDEVLKEAVAVVLASSFSDEAKRAAEAASIPVILTDGDHVADAIQTHRRQRRPGCQRCGRVSYSTSRKKLFITLGFGVVTTTQSLVKYFFL